jgi:hypothetical protein
VFSISTSALAFEQKGVVDAQSKLIIQGDFLQFYKDNIMSKSNKAALCGEMQSGK